MPQTYNIHTGSGSQYYNYNGPGQNINHGRDQNIHIGGDIDSRQVLWDEIKGVGASHRAEQQFSRGECLEGTREEVLAVIHSWRISRSGALPPILWLSGAAGIGKTSIAMSIAKSCEDDGLVCSFFFFRTDDRRNNPSSLMLSIAHGLAVTNASARETINDIITANPAVLEARLEDQFKELVLQPSAAAVLQGKSQSQVRRPRFEGPDLVIIDGLDECSDEETQLRILSAIASGYRRSPQFPLRFLVCSRSESWLQEAFDAQPLHPLTKHLALDRDTIPGADIGRYYRHEFEGIRASPKYRRIQFPDPWPSKEALRRLLENSSGQFIYAVTATGFVKSGSSSPVKQLQIILEYSPEKQLSKSPFPQLDRLYYIVLCASTENDDADVQRDTLVSVLAAILLVHYPVVCSPEFIELLLGLSKGEVDLALRSMYSVLDIGGSKDSIYVFHTSFTEYLHDGSRSGRFCIDREKQHRSLAIFWLRALAREVKASPEIILNPGSRSQSAGDLVDVWVTFCHQDEFMTDPEFSREVDSVYHAILSVFPNQDQLIAQLASVILLPSYILPHQLHVNDLLVRNPPGSVLSTLQLLKSCRLATSRKRTGRDGSDDVRPFLRDSLSDFLIDSTRSGEFFIEKDTHRHSLSSHWVRILSEEVKKNPGLILHPTLRTGPFVVLGTELRTPPFEPLVCLLMEKGSVRDSSTELSNRDVDLYSSILSVFPDRTRLIASLASVILLPHRTLRNDFHFHDFVLELPRGYVLSVLELLHSCQLDEEDEEVEDEGEEDEEVEDEEEAEVEEEMDTRSHFVMYREPEAIFDMDPCFVDFLTNSTYSKEFFIDTEAQSHSLALRWTRTLARPFNATPSPILPDSERTGPTEEASLQVDQLGKLRYLLYTKWIDLCLKLAKPSPDLLNGLRDLDLSALFLYSCLQSAYHYMKWSEAFSPVVEWLKSSTDHVDLGIIERFKTQPQCFHLKAQTGSPEDDDILHWAILNTTGCAEYDLSPTRGRAYCALDRMHRMDRTFPLRLTDCRCHESGIEDSASEHPSHRTYQTACLKTLKALVSDFCSIASDGQSRQMNGIFRNVVDSSLLLHCAFETPLFDLCQMFFASAQICSLLRMTAAERETRRQKLLEWLKTCPERYDHEAEALRSQIISLFPEPTLAVGSTEGTEIEVCGVQ